MARKEKVKEEILPCDFDEIFVMDLFVRRNKLELKFCKLKILQEIF
jgi:hypothetical protein